MVTEVRIVPRSDALSQWEDVLRPLLRYAILCGDVAIKGSGYDTPLAYGNKGLDTDRRLAYVDVVVALWKLQSKDPLGHDLVKRSIGFHCGDDNCRLLKRGIADRGHWHKMSWVDLYDTHTAAALDARLEAALLFICEYVA